MLLEISLLLRSRLVLSPAVLKVQNASPGKMEVTLRIARFANEERDNVKVVLIHEEGVYPVEGTLSLVEFDRAAATCGIRHGIRPWDGAKGRRS